jgi:NAD(P)-dependent dehydrogenase (short-subunit alcohol dehydrogenase family)
VLQFIEDGCNRLVVTDIDEESLKETVSQAEAIRAQVRIKALAGDISSEFFVQEVVSLASFTFGRLDYAVNCAGISGRSGGSTDIQLEDYQKIQRINAEGCWCCQRAELQAMLKQEEIEGYRRRNRSDL